MKVSAYAKFIVGAISAAVAAVVAAVSDNAVSHTEVVTVILAALTALGVYVVPNADDGF